jgi:hypothetical protein
VKDLKVDEQAKLLVKTESDSDVTINGGGS